MSIDFLPTLEEYKFTPERQTVQKRLDLLPAHDDPFWGKVADMAAQLADEADANGSGKTLHDLVGRFSLSSAEGLALMGLAEALLRVEDPKTADALIADKLSNIDVRKLFADDTDMTARLVRFGIGVGQGALRSTLAPLARPFVRRGVRTGIKTLGSVFVLAESIDAALTVTAKESAYAYSFDMLGEGARTVDDAQHYFEAYDTALTAIARRGTAGSGLSVKLSAIYPRYDAIDAPRAVAALTEKLRHLARKAAQANIHLTIDAEETDRLTLSFAVLRGVLDDAALKDWDGLGLAVQAYQKRSLAALDYLESLGRPMQVRLVKGAYWDTEIRRAQLQGLPDYPVFTRKEHTDVSYLSCAAQLLDAQNLRPHFATHNAHTAATLLTWADARGRKLKFQRLHGMGAGMGRALLDRGHDVTVYAPVGTYRDLLAYLVRRLLENGANSSFISRMADPAKRALALQNPLDHVALAGGLPHPDIPLPSALYDDRTNSAGADIREPSVRTATLAALRALPPLPPAPADTAPFVPPLSTAWAHAPVTTRADVLDNWAMAMASRRMEILSLLIREAGKTLSDAEAELREAVDFCRYYAAQARAHLAPRDLVGPTGERNTLHHDPRGTFVCISPWNFPLAIFVGQIAAALVAGNTVVAKPAEQTPRIAAHAIGLLQEIAPQGAVHLVFGDGATGKALVQAPNVAGVAFTGSFAAAKSIARDLAAKDGPIVPLIAETGGLNAMIVDTTALPEQVVDDCITSAFLSAGQRCSSLRLLCLPRTERADAIIRMLTGAMACLRLGDPLNDITDIGPIIDREAFDRLKDHESYLTQHATILHKVPDGDGLLFGPLLAELKTIDALTEEKFGPILHVVRYDIGHESALIAAINAKGYGLTFGVHSRVRAAQDAWCAAIAAGNAYVNRSMIGAVVGVQPFGGRGLSGTGPKAGGPNYLHAFTTERLVSVDLTAAGGNAVLLNLSPDFL